MRGLDLHVRAGGGAGPCDAGRSEPEHRTITAAFIDIMDTDAQLERLGIDGLGRALDERIRTIQEVALHYEVPFYESDIGKSSVKALLTAGAPSSTGRDEERMLRALREIVETPGDVQMRIGVNTGASSPATSGRPTAARTASSGTPSTPLRE